jgi:hypothetical protein
MFVPNSLICATISLFGEEWLVLTKSENIQQAGFPDGHPL